MKSINLPWILFFRIKDLNEIFSTKDIFFLKKLYELLIIKKKYFLAKPSNFIDLIENKIFKEYSMSLLTGDIKFIILFKNFLKRTRYVLNKKNNTTSYFYLIKGISFILQKKFFNFALLETSNNIDEEYSNMAREILNNHNYHPSSILCKINPNMIGGFKIYFKLIRIELNYKRILEDINLNTKKNLGKI